MRRGRGGEGRRLPQDGEVGRDGLLGLGELTVLGENAAELCEILFTEGEVRERKEKGRRRRRTSSLR